MRIYTAAQHKEKTLKAVELAIRYHATLCVRYQKQARILFKEFGKYGLKHPICYGQAYDKAFMSGRMIRVIVDDMDGFIAYHFEYFHSEFLGGTISSEHLEKIKELKNEQ